MGAIISCPVFFREKEKVYAITSLCCLRKNSLIVTGPSGVGKTAFVHSLAPLIDNYLPNHTLIEISAANIIAGCRYRREFEEKVSQLLEICIQNKIIIYFDEAHTLSMTGGADTGGIDAINMLKPHLSKNLRCILSSTEIESAILMDDKAFQRRFRLLSLGDISKKNYFKVIESKFKNCKNYTSNITKEVIKENPEATLHEAIDLVDFKITEISINKDLNII